MAQREGDRKQIIKELTDAVTMAVLAMEDGGEATIAELAGTHEGFRRHEPTEAFSFLTYFLLTYPDSTIIQAFRFLLFTSLKGQIYRFFDIIFAN